MRKYFTIFKSELMSNLQYIFDYFISFVSYFLLIFILMNLWNFLYNDPTEVINGYTCNQMIWYVMITEVLWMSLSGRKLSKKIAADVRGGNIAYNINKPYSYIGYSVATHLGDILVKFLIYFILAIGVGLIFTKVFYINALELLLVLLTCILANVISILMIICIGLISFFIEDSQPFYWLYSKLMLIVGTLFPIEYLPTFLQPFIKYSPIVAISYGPAKLFVSFSYSMFFKIILSQLLYLIGFYLLASFIYKKGVKKLNVNGG